MLAGVLGSSPTWSLVSSTVCGYSQFLSHRACGFCVVTNFVSLDVSSPSYAVIRGSIHHPLAVDLELGEVQNDAWRGHFMKGPAHETLFERALGCNGGHVDGELSVPFQCAALEALRWILSAQVIT